MLEQAIWYRVPPKKFGDLAQYDGSVWAERTKGVMAARCHFENMNYVALNLAHRLIEGQLTVASARSEYEKLFQKVVVEGKRAPESTKLLFKTLKAGLSGDLDKKSS